MFAVMGASGHTGKAAADIIVSTLEKLKPEYPTITEEKRRELEAARKALEQEEAKG